MGLAVVGVALLVLVVNVAVAVSFLTKLAAVYLGALVAGRRA